MVGDAKEEEPAESQGLSPLGELDDILDGALLHARHARHQRGRFGSGFDEERPYQIRRLNGRLPHQCTPPRGLPQPLGPVHGFGHLAFLDLKRLRGLVTLAGQACDGVHDTIQ